MSPERVNGFSEASISSDQTAIMKLSDVWSAGCIFYFLITGRLPFQTDYIAELPDRIKTTHLNYSGSAWLKVPISCMNLITQMLKKDHIERIDVASALSHEFFVEMAIADEKTKNGSPIEAHWSAIDKGACEEHLQIREQMLFVKSIQAYSNLVRHSTEII